MNESMHENLMILVHDDIHVSFVNPSAKKKTISFPSMHFDKNLSSTNTNQDEDPVIKVFDNKSFLK